MNYAGKKLVMFSMFNYNYVVSWYFTENKNEFFKTLNLIRYVSKMLITKT